MSARTALSTAASTVTGVNVTEYFRQSLRPGDGFVRWDSAVRDASGFGFMDAWEVVVCLPQDLATAEKWIETNGSPLIEALEPHLVITGVRPGSLPLDDGTSVPVLAISGNRESTL